MGIYIRVFSEKEFDAEVLEKMIYWDEPYFPRKGEMIGWGLFANIFKFSEVYDLLTDESRQKWDAYKLREEERAAQKNVVSGLELSNIEERCLLDWMDGKNFVVSNVVWNYDVQKYVCLDVTIEYD